MTERDVESSLLTRCTVVARGGIPRAQDQREANVFKLAAQLILSQFPNESESLERASQQYFAVHPAERLDAEEVVRRGWITNMPRLRVMLIRRFS